MRELSRRFLTPETPVFLGTVFIVQCFTTFLTGVKLVPGLRNNFGPFEVLGLLLICGLLALYASQPQDLSWHPLLRVQLVLCGVAVLSLLWFQGPEIHVGLIQVLILVFQLIFVLVTYNFMLKYQISPEKLLRLVVLSALIIGPWVLLSGIEAEGSIQASGPFRNRAHMANYMLTAFWLVLLFNTWPGIKRRERFLSFLALASTLYPIAASGRRSVYLSLIIGLIAVGSSFLVAARGRRRSALLAALVVFGFISVLYTVGPRWVPQLAFFQQRVAGIGDRLEMAVREDDATEANFYQLQRAGVRAAVSDYPLLGIGWGAFYGSRYSLTNHEVHSTPLRFLAELGIVGLALYIAQMGILLLGSLRILLLLRATAYRTTAVTLVIAVGSMAVSWLYNRHITERTFWLLLLFFVTFDAFARSVARRAHLKAARARPWPRRWSPDQVAAAMARPRPRPGALGPRRAGPWVGRLTQRPQRVSDRPPSVQRR